MGYRQTLRRYQRDVASDNSLLARAAMFMFGAIALGGCIVIAAPGTSAEADTSLRRAAADHFAPLTTPTAAAPAVVALGRELHRDERMSSNAKTSCATCHSANAGGGDSRRYSTTATGGLTPRNSITVFNSMQQPALRWLADRPEGAAMAEGLLTGPLGFKTLDAARQAMHDAGYADRFKAAFAADATPLTTKTS